MAFAKEMLKISEVMKACRGGCPKSGGDIPLGVETVAALPPGAGDCFASAALTEVYNYLRGGKPLSIPDNWRPVLPAGFLGF